jgi:signal transduction histidine kinase
MIEESIAPGIHVVGDAKELGKLVKILLDNAVKYSVGGKPVTVALTHEGNRARLAVTNYGDVLSPEDCERVFDRFYRSDKARSRETGGYGLGLTIAKAIAQGHGATIGATSSAETGTTFYVVFREK